MARAIEKGATYLDKLCHKLYDEPKGRGFQVDGKCRRCGGSLMTYYCEDRLHLVACEKCGTLALTKAVAPQVAANLTLRQPTPTPPNEWVSVEERLPEYNPSEGAKSYWIAKKDCYGNWQMKFAQFCDYGYAMTVDAETEVTWRDWDFTKIVGVTHWMHLPEPPCRRPPEGEEDT